MKKAVLVFLLFFHFIQINAQYPKLIIRLKDKAFNTYNLANPTQYLSERALQRRLRYNIPIDSFDLPVAKRYLDSISGAGNVVVLSPSKWLNEVLIETTDQNAINKIRSFPFVLSAKGVGYRSTNNSRNDKFKETVAPLHNSEINRPTQITADTYNYGNSYDQVHIHEGEFLHNKGFHGETMQIAVLDAGFQQYKSINAFDSIRSNGQILGERDLVAFDNSVNEDDAHGMHCLSILSANWPGRMVGTAPKAKYWLIRTENSASEYPIEEHNWVAGAELADSTGSDMISSSLGYNTFDDPSFDHSYNDLYKNTTAVSQGASLAVKKGMIVMVSAGNEGSANWKYISFPADADSICAVGAINNAGLIAGFSSYGYPGKIKPDIVSVGVGTVIAGLNNEPVTGNGTSYSNPNIAGLIACLWQAFPGTNNMKILDAVYKSADRYNAPDDRFGYGIPDFKVAYRILKHDENISLYGNEWFFATPNPFTSKIDVKFIGRADGPVTLSLINADGQIVAKQNFTSEKEEVYNFTFTNLGGLPGGNYLIKYADSLTTRTISLPKEDLFGRDWIVAVPNPFTTDVEVFIKAQETGEATLRLIDAKGSIVDEMTVQLTENVSTSIRFNNAYKLAKGIYFLRYSSKTQKRTIRILKG